MSDNDGGDFGSFLAGFVIGGLVGGAVALVLAPRSGAETRSQITGRGRELVDAGYNMPETITSWRDVLHHLMRAFLDGEAQIDPKNGRKTCTDEYCELQRLCRIDELEHLQSEREAAEMLP